LKYAKLRGFKKLIDKKINLGSFDSFERKNTGKKQNKFIMKAKNSYNTPETFILKSPEIDYTYCDEFTSQLSLMLFKPILAALKERKQSKQSFVKEINLKGLKYTYAGFNNTARGKNPFVKNLGYFIKLYEYLQLPFPSIEYLSSFD